MPVADLRCCIKLLCYVFFEYGMCLVFIGVTRGGSVENSDVNRVKIIVKLAKHVARINKTNQHIDVVEFSQLLNPEDVLLFLEEYCFYVQQRGKDNFYI